MNCAKCEDLLSEYLENALDALDRASVESHLQSCSACAELLAGVRGVIQWGKEFSAPQPSPWLSSRILASTPQVIRITWRDWVFGTWKKISEPRFALALLTSTLVLGWMGNMVGISAPDIATLRHPSAIYYRIEGWANRVYGDAVRSYYSSPLVNAIQCQIHSRIEQFRENS
jgi:predicted anti-sigma-YlaC factor YlaD